VNDHGSAQRPPRIKLSGRNERANDDERRDGENADENQDPA
jgi:hypothetical protein